MAVFLRLVVPMRERRRMAEMVENARMSLVRLPGAYMFAKGIVGETETEEEEKS